MRWSGQQVVSVAPDALPGLARVSGLVRSVRAPEFSGVTFHEVMAKSALNKVPGSHYGFGWTINPYRGCTHACVYCFARPTHNYLDLDSGDDFDRQIIVKVNVVDILRKELGRAGWNGDPVALGTNTDPYQRAEGRYALMPGILRALADSRTPISILTKGTLLRRDLDLLAELSTRTSVDIAMSIAVFDDDLQQSVEPGTPSTSARLATVAAACERGLDCTVFMMPLLPYLTDTRAHLDAAMGRIAESGARRVLHSALYLKPGTKEWYFEWLQRTRPDLVPAYRALYSDGVNTPKEYRAWLGRKVDAARRAHGLDTGTADPSTGAMFSRAARRPLPAADPTLF
ncbi:MAG: Rv2578c family radical SAM protein [Naasia sp.]